MSDLAEKILDALGRPSYSPVKPKVLAKRMGLPADDSKEFSRVVRNLVHGGRIEVLGNSTLRLAKVGNAVIGTFRRANSGHGFVRLDPQPDQPYAPDILIPEGYQGDAATGDRVLVKLNNRAGKMANARGQILRILERATRTFVGTYFERGGEAFVRVDGTVFAHSVSVGDPGAKGVKPQDKVQIEMIRFPDAENRGEGVIVEVFGPLSQPGVDLITIIKSFGLPEEFPEAALNEARAQADAWREELDGREDFSGDTVVTIDPVDARDFDDAVGVETDPKTKHWILTVHIADVSHFAKAGGPLDTEAKRRATSVYLPQKVIPMFPEIISNGLASLQQGQLRFVKSVRIEFTHDGKIAHVHLANGAIRVAKRFSYEEVSALLNERGGTASQREPQRNDVPPPSANILALLHRMRDLALILRAKRKARGALELTMPEAVLEYDADGRVSGAHFAVHDLSHQIIEEFMLTANEAVAAHFSRLGVPFLRRIHPAPNEEKLEEFAQFAGLLGHRIKQPQNRFELQKLLDDTAETPERAAIHFAMLRSLKQATYSPIPDEHYALASIDYCHFTSPIRRYPDLQVHRLLDRWLRTGKAQSDEKELIALGDHCSKMERRAETAERELVKLKILQFLSTRLGEQLDAVITGVADYGFFAQAERIPAEGLVHISSLTDDFYSFDDSSRSLIGGRTKKRYRLGDRVVVEVGRVDLQKRMLDFRLKTGPTRPTTMREFEPRPRPGLPTKPAKGQGRNGKRKR
jgi:ribonuclease R